ncbi:MAG: response regulator [Terriglobia bacterium]
MASEPAAGRLAPPPSPPPSPKPKIRIVIADDHEIVRRGLRTLLEGEAGHEICGEARDGHEAVELVRQRKPSVVVLDISMPGLNGLEAARHIRKASEQTEILAITAHDSEQLARSLLAAGVRGYILKSDLSSDLVAGVESLHRHRPFFTTKVARIVLEGYLREEEGRAASAEGGESEVLTAREREIIQLLAEGKSNKEVASLLDLSVKTAETHRANLMRKLHLHSVSELVHYAVRNGIIEP